MSTEVELLHLIWDKKLKWPQCVGKKLWKHKVPWTKGLITPKCLLINIRSIGAVWLSILQYFYTNKNALSQLHFHAFFWCFDLKRSWQITWKKCNFHAHLKLIFSSLCQISLQRARLVTADHRWIGRFVDSLVRLSSLEKHPILQNKQTKYYAQCLKSYGSFFNNVVFEILLRFLSFKIPNPPEVHVLLLIQFRAPQNGILILNIFFRQNC